MAVAVQDDTGLLGQIPLPPALAVGGAGAPSAGLSSIGALKGPSLDLTGVPIGVLARPAPPAAAMAGVGAVPATPPAVADILAQPNPAFDHFWSQMTAGESAGGKDIPNYRYDTTHTASGPGQQTDTNWHIYARKLGIDVERYPTAMSAPDKNWAKAAAKLQYMAEGRRPWDRAHGGSLPVGGAERPDELAHITDPDVKAAVEAKRSAIEDLQKKQADLAKQLNASSPDSAERRRLMNQLMEQSLHLSQQFGDLQKAIPQPKSAFEAMSAWTPLMIAMVTLAGRFSRAPATASMGAAASALTGLVNGNDKMYERSVDAWKHQTEVLKAQFEAVRQELDSIWHAEDMDWKEKQAQLELRFKEFGLDQDLTLARAGLWGDAYKMQTDRMRVSGEATLKSAQTKAALAEADKREAETKILQSAGTLSKGSEEQFIAKGIQAETARLGRPLTPSEEQTLRGQLHGEYAKSAAVGRGEAGEDLSKKIYGDETIETVADSFIAGNDRAMVGLARGTAGQYAMARVWKTVGEKLREQEADEFRQVYGRDPDPQEQTVLDKDRGRRLAIAQAEFQGIRAGERTAFTRAAGLVTAAAEAKQFTPQALETSAKVSRTEYPTMNAIELAVKEHTGNTDVIEFHVANVSLADAYAQVIGRGNTQLTDAARSQAMGLLNKAWSEGQYEAAVRRINLEIDAAQKAPEEVIKRFREGFLQRQFAAPAAPVGATEPGRQAAPATETPHVTSQQQYDALSPGAHYIGPDGHERVKP